MKRVKRIINNVTWKGHLKSLRIKPGGQVLEVPLSACVSEGDAIKIEGKSAWVIGKNGECQFYSPYYVEEKLKFGGLDFKVAIKEITEQDEYVAYRSLSEFHYRGHALHGRTARLIIRSSHPAYPKVIGVHASSL